MLVNLSWGRWVLGTLLCVMPKKPLIHDKITVMHALSCLIALLRHHNVPMDKVEVSIT